MIPYKLFFRGFYWLNLILSPFHLYMMLMILGGYPTISGFHEATFRILLYLNSVLGPQIMSLGTLIFIAKLWDVIIAKTAFNSKNVTWQGVIFSAIVNATLFTVIGNVCIDNLFSFKHGNYSLVFMPMWALSFYYLICYLIGNLISKPKWLT